MISFKLNRSDYKLIWAFTICSVIWLALKFWTESHPLSQILFDIPIIIAKTLAGFFIVRWLIQKYIIEKRQYYLFFLLTTLALIATGFADLLRDYFGRGLGWGDLPSAGYIFIHSFYYSAADLGVPFLIIIAKKYFENQALLAKTREQHRENELKLLRAQMNPHFLFNNLNTLDALIDTNPEQAKAYVARLSSLYRQLISTKDSEITSVRDELKMANDYVYLIETRFGDAYSFQLDTALSTEEMESYLPTGALQTLIENVVKHNKVSNGQPVVAKLYEEDRYLVVTNNRGAGAGGINSLGTGLKNLEGRYELLTDKKIEIADTETHFTVRIPMLFLSETQD